MAGRYGREDVIDFRRYFVPGQNSMQLLHFVQDKQLFYPSSVISLSYLKGEENNIMPEETTVEGEEVKTEETPETAAPAEETTSEVQA